ncbi:hypothetical protein TB1_014121 [Malus domestica]
MTNYFHNIFTSTRSLEDSEIIGAMEPRLTPEMNRCLEMRISEEEVRKTIFQMQPAKAPGPYGMNPFFYQWYWHIMGMDVTKAIMNFFASGRLLKQVNFTHVKLIPKSKCPKAMNQIRLISLCNIFFRIISKVMANQLKLLLPAVVSQNQSALVPGRNISDNTILALEISNYLFCKRGGKKGFVSLKLDISKAYDHIEWSFLQLILSKMGFSSKWINLVMLCVSRISYFIIIIGCPKGLHHSIMRVEIGRPLIIVYVYLMY